MIFCLLFCFPDKCEEKYKKLHTNLTLRYKIEKIEKMSKPDIMSVEEWDDTSRFQKWKIILNENEQFIFYEFMTCVKQEFNDATLFA